MGDAIRFFNITTQDQLVTCNDMINNYNCIKLEDADIGNQYSDGTNNWAQDNLWTNYINTPLKGLGVLFNTQFNTQSATFPDQWYPDPGAQSPPNQYLFPNEPSQGNCDQIPGVCPDCEQEAMVSIINEEDNYRMLNEDQQYAARRGVFLKLAYNQDLMNNDEYGALLTEFYEAGLSGNFGQFLSVYNNIEDGEINSAADINSAITPENNMEVNEKMLNQIYLATW
jgi:hypothetical protein